ncbi:hypothetical protein BK026_06490 [Alteromonas sp. V450]|nr:hypothetical protein BK026_06490 [Alteromonas sp. V450]
MPKRSLALIRKHSCTLQSFLFKVLVVYETTTENELALTRFRFLNSQDVLSDSCKAFKVLITKMLSGGIKGSEMVKYDKC